MNKNFSTIFDKQRKGKGIDLSFLRKAVTKSVFRQESGEDIVWCRKRGEKCVARSLRFLYAQGAPNERCFARGFCRDSGNIAQQYFSHNKKGPCDRVHIGCVFAPLIWLCLKQGSLLQRTLWSGSYRVHLCTIDLIVFEAKKHWLRGSDCTGNVWGSDSVNYLHFLYPCWNSLNQGNINILYWFNASCQLLS